MHFEKAQLKLDAAAIKREMDEKAEEEKTVKEAVDAVKASQEKSAAEEKDQSKKEADQKAKDEAAKAGQQNQAAPPGQSNQQSTTKDGTIPVPPRPGDNGASIRPSAPLQRYQSE